MRHYFLDAFYWKVTERLFEVVQLVVYQVNYPLAHVLYVTEYRSVHIRVLEVFPLLSLQLLAILLAHASHHILRLLAVKLVLNLSYLPKLLDLDLDGLRLALQ